MKEAEMTTGQLTWNLAIELGILLCLIGGYITFILAFIAAAKAEWAQGAFWMAVSISLELTGHRRK